MALDFYRRFLLPALQYAASNRGMCYYALTSGTNSNLLRVRAMDRGNWSEFENSDNRQASDRVLAGRSKWKKRRSFTRKNRKASRPATYMGQRRNNHPTSGL